MSIQTTTQYAAYSRLPEMKSAEERRWRESCISLRMMRALQANEELAKQAVRNAREALRLRRRAVRFAWKAAFKQRKGK